MSVIVKGGGGKPEEEKTVTAGTSAIVVNPSSGKAMKKVTVNPTPTETKSVTPTTSELTVTPSAGKHLSQVVVGAVEDVTPEVTAQTPVINQIAENLGVTITTPSGTNKQILQGNNANLLNIKNNAKKEGAYAWKKCSRVTKNVTLSFTHTPPKTWTVSSNDIDVHSIDSSFFIGFSGYYVSSEYAYEFVSANKALFNGNYISYTYNPDTAQIVFGSTVASSDIYISDATQEKVNYTFIDYVVSDSPTDYPDGGEQDGYWYRKADSGLNVWKKCLSGTITVTQANQNSNPTILQLASNDIDLGLLTEKDFYGYSGTVSGSGSFEFLFSEKGFEYRGAVRSQYTYDSVNHQLKLGESFSGLYTFPNYEAKIMLGYVVSDKSDAYPDGGIQDGYWYEKVAKEKEVIAKSGNYTFSGAQDQITIPHGIGKKPNYFGITNAELVPMGDSASVYVEADATNINVRGYSEIGDYGRTTTIGWNAVYIGG